MDGNTKESTVATTSSNNNNKESSKLDGILSSLQLAICQCRPKSFLQFSIKYFQDEKLPTNFTATGGSSGSSSSSSMESQIVSIIEENHAIHMLPFLISQPEEFRNVACIIFCHEQIHGNIRNNIISLSNPSNNAFTGASFLGGASSPKSSSIRNALAAAQAAAVADAPMSPDATTTAIATGASTTTNSNAVANLLSPQSTVVSTNTTANPPSSTNNNNNNNQTITYREYLDGYTMLDIMQIMDLGKYGLSFSLIEEVSYSSFLLLHHHPCLISVLIHSLVAHDGESRVIKDD
jgi:hypothetical protein